MRKRDSHGANHDCISCAFAPKLNVAEELTLVAYQASARTRVHHARINGNRVKLAGKAILYSICILYQADEKTGIELFGLIPVKLFSFSDCAWEREYGRLLR